MGLDFFSARSWMRQMKHGAHASYTAAERHHLCSASKITANPVPDHLFVESTRSMPKRPAGHAEFARTEFVIWIYAPETKAAPKPDFCLSIFAPRNIPTFGGPEHVLL